MLWDMTHLSVIWLIHMCCTLIRVMCDMVYSYMWHGSFMCDMAHSYVMRLIRMRRTLIRVICDMPYSTHWYMTHSYMTHSYMTHSYMTHSYELHPTWCTLICVLRDMTHSTHSYDAPIRTLVCLLCDTACCVKQHANESAYECTHMIQLIQIWYALLICDMWYTLVCEQCGTTHSYVTWPSRMLHSYVLHSRLRAVRHDSLIYDMPHSHVLHPRWHHSALLWDVPLFICMWHTHMRYTHSSVYTVRHSALLWDIPRFIHMSHTHMCYTHSYELHSFIIWKSVTHMRVRHSALICDIPPSCQ